MIYTTSHCRLTHPARNVTWDISGQHKWLLSRLTRSR